MDIKKAIDIIHDVVNEGFTVGDRVFSLDDEEREALEIALSIMEVIDDVNKERKRQDGKWGKQNNLAERWIAIFREKCEEMFKAINEFDSNPTSETEQNVHTETVQTVATCLAMLECMERIKEQTRSTDGKLIV